MNVDDFTNDLETIDTEHCNLYVPKHLVESYKLHPQWRKFKKIIQIE